MTYPEPVIIIVEHFFFLVYKFEMQFFCEKPRERSSVCVCVRVNNHAINMQI